MGLGRAGLRGSGRPEEAGLRGAGLQKGAMSVLERQTTGRGGARIQGRCGGGVLALELAADHGHSTQRYQGHVGASLVVGGVDVTGPQLYSVHPHGSYSRLPFTALGEHFCRPHEPRPCDPGLTFVLCWDGLG